MIEGVVQVPLKQIADERGKILHMLSIHSPHFTAFGEVYFSVVNPGIVKAWKYHSVTTQNIAVPVGKIKLVIYDGRPDSPTRGTIDVIETGEDHYRLVKIPPRLWYGFQGLSTVPALIANCIDSPYDSQEIQRRDFLDPAIPFRWTET